MHWQDQGKSFFIIHLLFYATDNAGVILSIVELSVLWYYVSLGKLHDLLCGSHCDAQLSSSHILIIKSLLIWTLVQLPDLHAAQLRHIGE